MDEMKKARAARAYLDSTKSTRKDEVAAFMDFFYPDMSKEKKRELIGCVK